MATISTINVSVANDNNGDTLRNAFVKTNDNFAELNTKKVEVELGKGLSENDFTDADKTKLDGIQAGAQVQLQSDWNQTDNLQKDYIRNKPIISTSLTESLPGKIADATSVKLLKDKQDEGVLIENLTGTQSKRVLLGKKIKFSGATVQANGDDAEVTIVSKTPLRVYLQVGANNTIAEEGNPNKPFADLYYWYRYFYNSSITYMEVVLLGVGQTFTFNGSFVNTWIDSAGTIQLGDAFIPTKFISLGANTIVFDCSSSANKQVFFTYDSIASQDRPVYFDMPASNITLNSCVLGQPTKTRGSVFIKCKELINNNYTVTDNAARTSQLFINSLQCDVLKTKRSYSSATNSVEVFSFLNINFYENTDSVVIPLPKVNKVIGNEHVFNLKGVSGFRYSRSLSTMFNRIGDITMSAPSTYELSSRSSEKVDVSFENSVFSNISINLSESSGIHGPCVYRGSIISGSNSVLLNNPNGSVGADFTFINFYIDTLAISTAIWTLNSSCTIKFINCHIKSDRKLFTFLNNVNVEIINSTILVGSTNYVMSGTDDATNNIKIINSVTDGLGWIESPSTLMVKTFLGATPTS